MEVAMVAERKELNNCEKNIGEEGCSHPAAARGNGHHDDHSSCIHRIHGATGFLHPFQDSHRKTPSLCHPFFDNLYLYWSSPSPFFPFWVIQTESVSGLSDLGKSVDYLGLENCKSHDDVYDNDRRSNRKRVKWSRGTDVWTFVAPA